MTPFQALYGYTPTHLSMGSYLPNAQFLSKYYLQERAKLQQLLKDNLKKAQQRMFLYANKHRQERSFEVGNQVYLKLQPFRQNFVHLRKNLKLSLNYYGPFTVTQKVGKVAYKLDLPQNTLILNVFHVSLLKKKISDKYIPSPTLPIIDDKGLIKEYPLYVFDKRMIKRGNGVVSQILIQWVN